MKRISLRLVIAAACGAASFSAKAAPAIELLQTGQFHGDEVTAVSGERWLGLYKVEEGYALVPVTLTVEPAFDALLDYDPKKPDDKSTKTGKLVAAAPEKEMLSGPPLVLLKGGGLIEGKVPAAVAESAHYYGQKPLFSFAPHWAVNLGLGNMHYMLSLNLTGNGKCELKLSDLKQMQIIARTLTDKEYDKPPLHVENTACHSSDNFPELLWAGDLDRDGKLDMLLKPRFHYNNDTTTLLLSSAAPKGKLMGLVARFTATGC